MKQLARWLGAVGRWLGEARLAWFGAAVVIGAVVFSFRPGAQESQIRIAGLILQILGKNISKNT